MDQGSSPIIDDIDPSDHRDWVAIEREFVHGDLSLQRIADRYHTSQWCIRDRAKKGGWVRLVGTKPLRLGRRPLPPGATRAKPTRPNTVEARRRKLIKRLLEALDKGLTQLETRMASDAEAGAAPASAADAERDTRSLSGLARLYAKLVELDDATKGGGKGAEGQETETSNDAGQLRRDLALRLQRLNQARAAR